MLKSIKIENFRSLKNNFILSFEEDMTLIVGENDAGKTSLVEALKVVLQNKKVEADDFSFGTNFINIEVKFEDKIYLSQHTYDGTNIDSKLFLIITHEKLNAIKVLIETEDFIEQDANMQTLRAIAEEINVTYRANTGFQTLKNNILGYINELLTREDPCQLEGKNPNLNVYFLDGKHFDDISLLINELYFKEKKRSIWTESINDNETIEAVINNKLNNYATEIRQNINEGGIRDRLRNFLPDLTEIAVTSSFEAKDLNINVNVRMLEGENEISIAKKGDGTKRRITLALLDYRDRGVDSTPIYILDEVDTHLHVKAQLELIDVLRDFIVASKQVIITTHSPFLINSCKPQQIRLLRNHDNASEVKYLQRDEDVNRVLRSIGVENTYLFFAKRILIVEGETEERFIPIIFERLFGINLYSNLVKIINVKGIKNVPGFARALLELNSKDNIYSLIDNDADEETLELINSLNLDHDHKFFIGSKEFEDSYEPITIYKCWKSYVEYSGRNISEGWTEEQIRAIRDECLANQGKFSNKLRELNSGCLKKLNKVNLGIALGEYCLEEELNENLILLLNRIRE